LDARISFFIKLNLTIFDSINRKATGTFYFSKDDEGFLVITLTDNSVLFKETNKLLVITLLLVL